MSTFTNDAASALLRALDEPIFNRSLHKEVGHGVLDYERYLKTRSLLSLQTRPDELVVDDELLFQVLHQAQELWLKAVAFEAVALVGALDADELIRASNSLDRMTSIARCLGTEIRILYTLAPDTFQVIRRQLGNGSGLESPGYNQVLLAADSAGEALERLIARRRATLLGVYTDRRAHVDLHHIAERFADLDEAVQSWLFAHFMLVRRTIGVARSVRALDGFPTSALPARMTKPLFPKLWEVRVEMTQSWDRGEGHAPGAPRTPPNGSGMHAIDVGADKAPPEEPSKPGTQPA